MGSLPYGLAKRLETSSKMGKIAFDFCALLAQDLTIASSECHNRATIVYTGLVGNRPHMPYKKFSTKQNSTVDEKESRFVTFELDLAGK